jgi:hypothetical protein
MTTINPEAWPKTSTLPKCSREQAEQFFAEAREFIKATSFYQSIRRDAECAVAEYIAYQQGYTIRDWSNHV